MITNIFLFILVANLATGFFAAAGVWQDMGVTYDTDLGGRLDHVTDEANKLTGENPGSIGGTLIDAITGTVGLLLAIGDVAVFGTGKLLRAFDTPGFIRTPINAIVPILFGLNVAAYLSGRDA